VFRGRTAAEWLDVLRAAGVPSSAVNDVAGALADPQAVARGAVVEHEHPTFGTVRTIASPLRVGEEEPPAVRAPFRGEHTFEVLAELCGYGRERIVELHEDGVFGDVELTVPATERR
jgi:crotonobetainyl-CoA:carnitine CoA-transferase CaiB-like acyl-CoA transferase